MVVFSFSLVFFIRFKGAVQADRKDDARNEQDGTKAKLDVGDSAHDSSQRIVMAQITSRAKPMANTIWNCSWNVMVGFDLVCA